MSYHTIDELQNFSFQNAYIENIEFRGGELTMILDQVTILSTNSKNRDIRPMRTNDFHLVIQQADITAFVEEGYKLYDADGNLKEQKEDLSLSPESYGAAFTSLLGCTIYEIVQENNCYTISIDTEDHTFLLQITGSHNTQSWERFFNFDA